MSAQLPKSVPLVLAIVAAVGCKRADVPAEVLPASAAAEIATKTPEPKVQAIEGVGLATPESVLYDAEADVYLVSNINGSPLAMDDNGFISRLSPDGKVLTQKWIDGARPDVQLSAPKGMALVGELLYVTDIDTVRKFDRKSGAARGEIKIANATFLNDLAPAPAGGVYVSDSGLAAGAKGFAPSGSDAVYLVSADDTIKPLAKGKSLGQPNGLWPAHDGVWVVTFGKNELYRVSTSVAGEQDRTLLPKGGLDGLVGLDDGSFLVSSWEASGVYRGKPGGTFVLAIKDVPSPADIGWDAKRKRVLIPLFEKDALRFVTLQ